VADARNSRPKRVKLSERCLASLTRLGEGLFYEHICNHIIVRGNTLQRSRLLLVALVVDDAMINTHPLIISKFGKTQSWFEEAPV